MSALHGWWTRLRRAFTARRFDAEMEAEMQAHRELEAAALQNRGLDTREAQRLAAVNFGSAEAYKESVRDRRMGRMLREMLADARYALRQFRNAPSFTAIAVATLALGIGASTAVFSALDGALFRPLPYQDPDRIAVLLEVIPGDQINNASGGAFLDWRAHQTSFEAICLTGDVAQNARYASVLERLNGAEVTHEYFSVFRISPLLGRGFLPTEDRAGGDNRVVVITEKLWRARFGASPGVLGTTLVLDEVPHTIVGVAPDDLIRPETEYFIPAVAEPAQDGKYSRGFHWAVVVGRLRPGVTHEQAEAELKQIKANLQSVYPVWKKDWSVAVRAPQPLIAQAAKPLVFTLAGSVGLVLLIACANVANLLLARGAQREQEIALRRALGATTGRLVRQVLTESVVLSLLGGVAGVLLATWTVDILRRTTAQVVPPAIAPQMDFRVLTIALVVSVCTGLIFGLLPALRARRSNVNDALKNGGRSATAGGRSRSQSALIVAEVALSIVLLTSAGLLIRSLMTVVASDPGFQPERVLAFDVSLPPSSYPTPQSRLAFSNTLQERLSALPGVEKAGTAMSIPFAGGGFGEKFTPGDRTPQYSDPGGKLDFVSPDYLQTLGAHLLAGRWLLPSDNHADKPRVGIINEAVAKLLFNGEMPVGKTLRVSGTAYQIVGVVRDLPDRSKDKVSAMFLYAPQAFDPSNFSVVVRSTASPRLLVGAVRNALRSVDSGLPMANVRTLDQAMDGSMKLRRAVLWIIGAFAVASLLLSCIGLYGVMSYSVASRSRELAIRMALGAARRDVLALVMRDGLRLIAVGSFVGLAGSIGSGHLLRSQLYGTSAYDPVVLILALGALTLVAAMACWWPAHRATRTDALSALRAD